LAKTYDAEEQVYLMNESVTHNQNQPERELILVLEMESKGTDLGSSMLRLSRVMVGHWFHVLLAPCSL
jgi:hypothetical protein